MDIGTEGGTVWRAGVEECSCKSYPCVTLKLNTYLLPTKMALSARPPLMGTVGLTVQTHTAPQWVNTRLALPYLVNPATHISFEPITVTQVLCTD